MKQGLHFGKMKEVAGAAENQLLYRLFFTSSPYIAIFYKSLIINNNSTRTCVQRISETFAVKVVQNAIAEFMAAAVGIFFMIIFRKKHQY